MQQFEKGGVELRNAIERIERQLASPAYIEGLRDQEFWFDNLVENGTFDADSYWTKGTGWTIGGGVTASATSTAGSLSQSIALVTGRVFKVQYEIVSYTSGSLIPQFLGGTTISGPAGSSAGVKTVNMTALAGNNELRFAKNGSADSYSIDNVSVFESDGTDIIHRMPTGWKPRRVFVDGILQREGATHDYEIKQDPEGYYIVPAVAPGANTETCILGVRT